MQFLPQQDSKTALVCNGEAVSYAAFRALINAFAERLDSPPGSRILLTSENRLEWAVAWYAIWKADCIPVPVDCMASADELAHIVRDCTPCLVCCSRERERTVRAALRESQVSARLLVFEDEPLNPGEPAPFPPRDPTKTAAIAYTSGTTGSPKGVMLSFGNLHCVFDSVSKDVPIFRANDRVLVLLPLHHILPLQGTLLLPLYLGATSVFSPSLKSDDVLNTLREQRVTLLVGVPRFFTLIRDGILKKIRGNLMAYTCFKAARTLRSKTFSRRVFRQVHERFGGHLRYLACGGAAIDNEVVRDFQALGFEVLTGYGMTETSPLIAFTHPGGYRAGTVGQVISVNEVAIQDGEITVRGPNVMQGYYRRPEETAEIIRDGWLHTGDLGQLDQDGYVTITGRKKEILVLDSAKNINPDTVEQNLLAHPAVSEAAVVLDQGMLHALIVPDMAALNQQGVLNIEEWFRWHVLDKYNRDASPHKRILRFSVTKEPLPRTRLGKLRRHELTSRLGASARREPPENEPRSETYRMLKEYVADLVGGAVYPDDHFELDLGLDSLGKVDVQVWLSETFGVDVSERDLASLETPRKLAVRIDACRTTRHHARRVNWGDILRSAGPASLSLPKSAPTHVWLNRLARLALGACFRLRGSGADNVPDGPCILAANHQSFLDGLFVSVFLRKETVKQTYFYAKAEHVRQRWLRAMARRHNVIVMDLNGNVKESLQALAYILRQGRKVLIFPEGTRSRDGSLGVFKHTFAILGTELGVPVVPVSIRGAFNALPAGQWIPRPFRRVDVSFLDPVYPGGEGYQALAERVFTAVKTHLSQS